MYSKNIRKENIRDKGEEKKRKEGIYNDFSIFFPF
jgi:hypothetical protein